MNKLRILGIGMTFVMLVSLLGFAGLTSAAGPGEQQWDYITEAYDAEGFKITANATGIDFVFSGTQGYMLDIGYSTTPGRVYRSANSGNSWSNKSAFRAISGVGQPVAIAVAPDDKLSIAVTDGVKVYISSNEGDTWQNLPTVTLGAGEVITDVAVGPARTGLLLAREYAITVANTGAGVMTGGDVKILGASATWTSAGVAANTRDYVAVEFSPNFISDRTLVAVGAANVTVSVQMLKTADSTVLSTTDFTGITGATLMDVGATNAIAAADIAMPTDFDPTSTSAAKAFVGIALTNLTGGVNKVTPLDGTTVRDLGLTANIRSVAFSGTSDSGTLFVGYYSTGDVKRSSNPNATTPDWTTATKKPTGTNVVVRLDSSYAFNQTIYALTRNDNTATPGGSAFSVSTDNGVSFYQTSGIDYQNYTTISGTPTGQNNLGMILDIKFPADESDTFYLTQDKGYASGTTTAGVVPATQNGSLHLWRSTGTQPTSTVWQQLFTIPKAADTSNHTGLLALNPAWTTTPAIYVVDNTASGASTVYVSKNGGATWSTRTGPGTSRILAIAVTDADTIFAAAGSSVYKSTNAGFFWADGVTGSSSANSMIVAPTGELILGRNGGIYTSTNQGATAFSSNSLGLDSAVGYFPAVNADYATNKTYFLAGTDGTVWRRGSADTTWINISPASPVATANPEIAFGTGDTLYVLSTNGVLRNLTPFEQNPNTAAAAWETMNAGTTVQFANNLAFEGSLRNMGVYGGINVLVSSPLDDTFSYRDTLATTAPTLTGPADGVEVSVDPNTGSGQPVLFTWGTVGTGAGVPTSFEIEIKEVGGVTTTSTAFGVNDIGSPSIGSTSTFGNAFLRANKEYEWRLRVRNTVSADAVRSAWSAARKIKVLSGTQVIATQVGPILLGPQGGSTTNLLPGFSWAPVAGATEYEFILATDAGLTQTVANTPAKVTKPSFSVTVDLKADTTYFWAVKSTLPTVGEQSIGTFTTRAPAAPPVTTAPAPITVTSPPITVNVPPITIPPQDTGPVIDTTLVWVVIGIGAILIIAVLVLIVRTRRPL